MRLYFTIAFVFICFLSFGQRHSVGVSVNSFKENNSSFAVGHTGINYAVNYRLQFNKKIGWQSEVNYGRYNDINSNKFATHFGSGITTPNPINPPVFQEPQLSNNSVNDYFLMFHSSVVMRVFRSRNIAGDIIIGPGIYRNRNNLLGLSHGQIMLSTYLSKKLLLGLPISYNYIFGLSHSSMSIGVSMRYYI